MFERFFRLDFEIASLDMQSLLSYLHRCVVSFLSCMLQNLISINLLSHFSSLNNVSFDFGIIKRCLWLASCPRDFDVLQCVFLLHIGMVEGINFWSLVVKYLLILNNEHLPLCPTPHSVLLTSLQ